MMTASELELCVGDLELGYSVESTLGNFGIKLAVLIELQNAAVSGESRAQHQIDQIIQAMIRGERYLEDQMRAAGAAKWQMWKELRQSKQESRTMSQLLQDLIENSAEGESVQITGGMTMDLPSNGRQST